MKLFTEKLKPLDLKKCKTVGDIVEAMSHCSFGARMLGDVSKTILRMITGRKKPLIVYDGNPKSPLAGLLKKMKEKKWFSGIMDIAEYVKSSHRGNAVVIGRFTEKDEEVLFQKPDRAIFVNKEGLADPNYHLKNEGYYPDVIFSDPRFVIPVLYGFLEERLENKGITTSELYFNLLKYGGTSAAVAHGAQVLKKMIDDPECAVFLTISGAMTIAKMSYVFCDMIESGMINHIATTGALLAHGLVEGVGLNHFKHNLQCDDKLLARKKINRVTDTLELESNLNEVENILADIFDKIDIKKGELTSPSVLNHIIGQRLSKNYPGNRGLLKSAYEKGVSVYIPAFCDSEVGNDLYLHNLIRAIEGRPEILMDLELDTERMIKAATASKKMAIFSIGGGVPRNNVQNIAPLIEIINHRLKINMPASQFSYGCRVCPDPPWFGHLSGCTYSEGMSWRKMHQLGEFAEIQADATIILPFLVKYIMEKKEKEAKKDP